MERRNKCKCGNTKDFRALSCHKCHLTKLGISKIGKPSPIKGKYRKRLFYECEICHKTFWKLPHKINRFCSFKCYILWRRQISKTHDNLRSSQKYAEWKRKVFEKHNSRCIKCNSSHNLLAHHVIHVSINPALIYDVDNGIVLCTSCHAKEHNFLSRFNNEPKRHNNIPS